MSRFLRILVIGAAGAALLFLLIVTNPLLSIAVMSLFEPEVTEIASTASPDRKWTAVVREEMSGSVGASLDHTVMLRPLTSLFGSLRQEKVFKIDWDGFAAAPEVIWTGPIELLIRMRAGIRYSPEIKREAYRDVHISYDLVSSAGN